MKNDVVVDDVLLRRRSGRPTKERALQLTEQIIGIATPLFLDKGYEATSIDSIVAIAQISKQTFYARFGSKDELFSAVVRRRMSDLIVPLKRSPSKDGSIKAVLVQVGAELIRRSLMPTASAIDRLISAESHQFPHLAAVYRENGIYVRELIAKVFEVAISKGEVQEADPDFLAEQFQYAVVDGPSRSLRLDQEAARAEASWLPKLVAAVDLFLEGCISRPRGDRAA